MTVLNQLASALKRRDELPNQELALRIIENNDHQAIEELVTKLSNKNKDVQSDCIKVLYEIGEHKAELISAYAAEFIQLLDSKSNRMQWGAMTALAAIVPTNAELIYVSLPRLIEVADAGSVITKDHLVNILIKLCSIRENEDDAFSLLMEQLLKSHANQLPMYAERAIPVINSTNKKLFIEVLSHRINDFDIESKRKRVEKIIRKFS
ncbi:hypothetical protein C3K47_06870 [Solitalea longa]|uniref:HEAT repeat domain-containing protein n=1 Tax=Solitalea longa TaxID=2079460 RepID=A0A2S5A596_9SPHI|nr:hypothetical protein [Solitalea longa]POY37479.1 hypothetical protein C3K47_06870 [Solitalea longa]